METIAQDRGRFQTTHKCLIQLAFAPRQKARA